MKKSIIVTIMLLLVTLVACHSDNNEKVLDDAILNFVFEEEGREVITDFSLPLETINEDKRVFISWEVTKGDRGAEVILNNQVVIHRQEKEIVEVVLTATFKYKDTTKTKDYKFYVLPFETEEPINKDTYVVYINIDGFARYYYDEAVKRGLVNNLEGLKKDGVFFDNLRTMAPSITNPVQAMIISGASSEKTENVYRYYDKVNDIVVQQQRENKADTIYHAGIRANKTMATVRHFPAEGLLNKNNLNRLYVDTETGTLADLNARFKQAEKLVLGEECINGTEKQTLKEVPRFLSVYVDDLDGLGHNEQIIYNKPVSKTEDERLTKVVEAVAELDIAINNLVNAYKKRGIYEKTAFFITTDHGMTPFGGEKSGDTSSKYRLTKWPNLRDKLKEINSEFVFEYVAPGKKPKASSTVIGVGGGLQMPLTFKNHRLSNSDLDAIARQLEKEEYIDRVLTRRDLTEQGFWRGSNYDLLVIPSERYHFHGRDWQFNSYYVRGQHDSLLDSSNHIYGFAFGGLIQNNIIYKEEAKVISFGVMMAEALGVKLRDANAEYIDIFN